MLSATDAVGIPAPHCELFVAVGAVGNGKTVGVTDAVIGHPLTVAVPVYVNPLVIAVVNGLVVPSVVVPFDQE